jgi:hypothetical protein
MSQGGQTQGASNGGAPQQGQSKGAVQQSPNKGGQAPQGRTASIMPHIIAPQSTGPIMPTGSPKIAPTPMAEMSMPKTPKMVR